MCVISTRCSTTNFSGVLLISFDFSDSNEREQVDTDPTSSFAIPPTPIASADSSIDRTIDSQSSIRDDETPSTSQGIVGG